MISLIEWAALKPKTAMETATGTVVVTRALAQGLSSESLDIVTDRNRPMLDHAADKQGKDERIYWHQAELWNSLSMILYSTLSFANSQSCFSRAGSQDTRKRFEFSDLVAAPYSTSGTALKPMNLRLS